MLVVFYTMTYSKSYCLNNTLTDSWNVRVYVCSRSAGKSLARPGRKQAAPVKSVMDRGVD